MNLNLFDPQEQESDCNHLPLSQRYFKGDYLYCGRCGKVLRHKDMTK